MKDIDEITSKFNDKISENKNCKKLMINIDNFSNNMKKVSILQQKCNNDPTFSFVNKLKHDYRLLFKKPNSYLNIAELEEKDLIVNPLFHKKANKRLNGTNKLINE